LPDTVPFIFYVKKGFLITVEEILGSTASDTINLYAQMECIPTSLAAIDGRINQIVIYPNPASSNLILEISTSLTEEKYLSIYNVLGEVVLKESFSTQKYSVDVSGLARSVYIAQIRIGKSVARIKLVKE
jgi:hypothetical protein